MKNRYPVYVMMIALGFLCGCETIGAFGTGRMTPSDVAYITHAGAFGKAAAPVNVDDLDAGEDQGARAGSSGLPPRPVRSMSQADSWLEENLW